MNTRLETTRPEYVGRWTCDMCHSTGHAVLLYWIDDKKHARYTCEACYKRAGES